MGLSVGTTLTQPLIEEEEDCDAERPTTPAQLFTPLLSFSPDSVASEDEEISTPTGILGKEVKMTLLQLQKQKQNQNQAVTSHSAREDAVMLPMMDGKESSESA